MTKINNEIEETLKKVKGQLRFILFFTDKKQEKIIESNMAITKESLEGNGKNVIDFMMGEFGEHVKRRLLGDE